MSKPLVTFNLDAEQGSELWIAAIHKILRTKGRAHPDKDRALSSAKAWIKLLVSSAPMDYTSNPALRTLLGPPAVYNALLPKWEEVMREAKRGFPHPTVAELCAIARGVTHRTTDPHVQ